MLMPVDPFRRQVIVARRPRTDEPIGPWQRWQVCMASNTTVAHRPCLFVPQVTRTGCGFPVKYARRVLTPVLAHGGESDDRDPLQPTKSVTRTTETTRRNTVGRLDLLPREC